MKIGGAALESPEVLRMCARAVADLAGAGHQVAVVHGGGAALTRTLAQLGKKSNFINGLRVTDSETRDVALMVLAGHINKAVVAALGAAGQTAMGMCGGDGLAFRARKKANEGCDLGFVRNHRRGAALDRSHLGQQRGAGNFQPGAGRRRPVL